MSKKFQAMKKNPSLKSLKAKHYQQGWELAQLEYQMQQNPKRTRVWRKTRVGMLKAICLLLLFTGLHLQGFSQKLTQTIRGKVIDQESQVPVFGASVLIIGTDPLLGSSTDMEGSFVIKDVPVGRHSLKISSIGYEETGIPELLVGSGKEIVLTIRLQESFMQLNEIVVTAEPEKGQPLNDMATVSARSFTVEETQRYAASINDPARMVLSFAGVSSSDDGSNEIIVRGNSPRGVLWRIEGMEVPNPNHFGEEGSSGGGVSMMSANMMDASDFYTGAFPAEYGNAYSGVFDINLRKGNNEKREYAAQIGLMGIDFAAEGPFSKDYNGSYLVNYRYSTLSLLQELGVGGFDFGVPVFQDLSYKIHLPTKNAGTFNLWGIGGLSNQKFVDEEGGEGFDFHYNMGVGGISHRVMLSDKTYLESALSVSKSKSGNDYYETANQLQANDEFWKTNLRGSWLLNHKINAKNTLRAGFIASHEQYDLLKKYSNADTLITKVDASGNTQLYQVYGQWKTRLRENITLNAGLHSMILALNNNYSIEPRLGLRWSVSPTQAINAGFGVHSKMEPLLIYFSRYKDQGHPNKDLEFMKAFHYVLGYENAFRPDWMLKAEVYYQQLKNVPIANTGTEDPEWLGYSAINYDGGFVHQPLVNEGNGQNYGIDVTLEKFFTNNYYLTLTGSVYDSEYTGRDGIERDTRYNGNFNANLLFGKEFNVGRSGNNILGVNIRTLTSGGRRWTPVLLEASKEMGEAVYDWGRRFEEREGMYFRTDLRLSYRRNKASSATIWSLDVQNMTNHQNVWGKDYNSKDQEIVTFYQMGLIPVLNYRIEF